MIDKVKNFKEFVNEQKINEDFLLLLVDNNGLVENTTISIDNHFEQETSSIKKLLV